MANDFVPGYPYVSTNVFEGTSLTSKQSQAKGFADARFFGFLHFPIPHVHHITQNNCTIENELNCILLRIQRTNEQAGFPSRKLLALHRTRTCWPRSRKQAWQRRSSTSWEPSSTQCGRLQMHSCKQVPPHSCRQLQAQLEEVNAAAMEMQNLWADMDQDLASDTESVAPSEIGERGETRRLRKAERMEQRATKRKKLGESVGKVASKFGPHKSI